MLHKQRKRLQRKIRIASKLTGTPQRPRLSVFRSNTNIYAQIIDDTTGKTLASSSDLHDTEGTKIARAEKVGLDIAKKAQAAKIENVVFDRNGFLYHGRVKALADSARATGLHF